jgi:hypothetical protein
MKGLLHFDRLVIPAVLFVGIIAWSFGDCEDQQMLDPVKTPIPASPLRRLMPEVLPQKTTKVLQGITFDSDYDNGSILDVTECGTNEFDCSLFVESGVLGTRKYWFRFRMTGVAGRTVTLNIDHSGNPRPFVSFDGVTWRRLTSSEAPSLSRIVLSLGAEENFAELAFFAPMGFEETYFYVSEMVRDCAYATTESIGQSRQGRDVWMVTVTDSSVPDTNKHRVWMHSRAHAGEVTSTHLLLGFLEQVTEDSPMGSFLRKHCIFNIIPLENIDGVYLGHTRWDADGYDLERGWCDPVTLPEVVNFKAKVDEFMAGSNPIEVALNLHSTGGNYSDTFFFKHVYPSVTHAFEAIEQRFIDCFDNATPMFNNLSPQTSQLSACIFIESYFWNNWGESVMAMTHEGHFYRRITDNEWITHDDYRELGRAMARCLIEYFNIPPLPGKNQWLFH